jgi:hypothetical protein
MVHLPFSGWTRLAKGERISRNNAWPATGIIALRVASRITHTVCCATINPAALHCTI